MLTLVLALTLLGVKLEPQPCPMVSSVQTSPDGLLTGALLWKPERAVYDDDESFPKAIVLLKRGTYWKEIPSPEFFVWRWIFWKNGKQVAIDDSPLHFVQGFNLIDVETGKSMQTDDPQSGHPLSKWAQSIYDDKSLNGKQDPNPHQDCRFQPK